MIRTTLPLLIAAALAVPAHAAAQEPGEIAEGARIWAHQCTRCHNARASSERTDAQWLTIVAHMRARGNLTRTEGRLVTTFLKATNLPVAASTATAPAWAASLTPEELALVRKYLASLDKPPQR